MDAPTPSRALIVFTHPQPTSLTRAVVDALAQGVEESGHWVEKADLAAEGFDPRFSSADYLAFDNGSAHPPSPPPAILAEQHRIERANALVLVFPVYWWSLPAQLKGWLDRVLTNGWAYGTTPAGLPAKQLARLPVHLLPLAWSSAHTYERHGYRQAMQVQIDHGIFDYVGARVMDSDLLYLDNGAHTILTHARNKGRHLFT